MLFILRRRWPRSQSILFFKFLILTMLISLLSCRTLPEPVVPQKEIPEDPVEAYKTYRLYTAGPKISFHLLQGYGEIDPTYSLLEPLFETSSEEAWMTFKKSRRRGKTGVFLSSVGGALMGLSLGYDLAIDSQGGTPVAVAFITGAVTAIIGIIVAGSSGAPFMDAVEAYNLDLVERWELEFGDIPPP